MMLGGTMTLARPGQTVLRMLRLLGIDEDFAIYPAVAPAVDATGCARWLGRQWLAFLIAWHEDRCPFRTGTR